MSSPTPCRSCGALIRWTKTHSGKAMPLDADPVTVDASTTAPRLYHVSGIPVRADAWGWAYGYRPHWATCPSAAGHRKSERGTGPI